ncbi:hypothetical protein CU044_4295 [Streptomyces sp. L-9-10]|nr:hypothetical protein CU044_4295 [Streptomyces sp. L-9-10]
MQLTDGGGQRDELGPVTAQGGYEGGLRGVELSETGQHAAGTDLQEDIGAPLAQRHDRVVEPYGPAYVPHPVLRRGKLLRGGPRTGQRRHDRDRGRLVRHALQHRAELVQHRVHQRRVERVTDAEPGHLPPRVTPPLRDRLHIVGDTGDDHRVRAVHRSDTHGLRQVRGDLGLGRLDRHHRTTGRQRLHQRTTRRHHLHRVRQRPHARHVRGGQLTDRMTRQHIRPDTPRLQQTEQRHLDREQRRLRHPRLVQRIGILTEQHLADLGAELTQHRVQRFREHRETLGQFTTHAQPLRALTREQETQPMRRRLAHRDTGTATPLGESGEPFGGGGPVLGQQYGAVLEHAPCRGQREADPHRVEVGGSHHGGQETVRLRAQPVGGTGGQHPRRDSGDPRLDIRGGLLIGGGRLLQDDVGVRPADAERGHTGAARFAGLRPRLPLGQQRHGAHRPVDMAARLADVQGLGQHTVPHRHDHLDDAADPGRRLGMADVRLQGPQPERPVVGPLGSVGRDEGLRLDRVAERGAGAVCLDRVHLRRGEPRARQRLTDHRLLGRSVRRGQAVGRAVLVHRGTAYDRQHLVAVAAGVGQPLHEQHPDALAPAGAVGAVRERLAAAVHGQRALPAVLDECARRGHERGAARERQRALLAAQRDHREVQRHERRRACRVHRHRGPDEAERVGDPAGRDTAGAAVGEEALESLGRLRHPRRVVVVHDAREHAGPGVPGLYRVDARALEGLPGGLQQEPLLRVRRQRLTR